MDGREYVLDEINLLMIRKQTTEGMQAQKPRNRSISKAHAGRGDLQDKHTQTHLPCVSVDWVNQPNFPFFFSVRSASVTPWCYQHAVHTARQQRKQWVSTQQREQQEREESTARDDCNTNYSTDKAVQKSYNTQCTGYTIISSWNKRLTAESEPGLWCPTTVKLIQYIFL